MWYPMATSKLSLFAKVTSATNWISSSLIYRTRENAPSIAVFFGVLAVSLLCAFTPKIPVLPATRAFPLPTVDFSADASRQVVVAQGTSDVYQGHPTTLLLPDGKTMYCVWTIGHGGPLGPLKRSDDGGRTWSGLLPVPASWPTTRNCPTIYRLPDPQGTERLLVYAGQGAGLASEMHVSFSLDDGKSWSEMKSTGLDGVAMPFCAVIPVDGGQRLLGVTNIRRPGETTEERSNVLAQSCSTNGGLTWSRGKFTSTSRVSNHANLNSCAHPTENRSSASFVRM